MDAPIKVGRYDGSGSLRGFQTMREARKHVNEVLAKEDPFGLAAGFYYVEAPLADRFGRRWCLPPNERCRRCGQPDNCGDCNHKPLDLEDALMLGAIVD